MLGSLRADMSRQGVQTPQKGCCNACEKPIVGQVLRLSTTELFMAWVTRNLGLFRVFLKTSVQCFNIPWKDPPYWLFLAAANLWKPKKEPVPRREVFQWTFFRVQVITALGRTWHPEHFTCAHCNQELGTRNFFERDGRPYCEPDYHNLFSPRCAYCNGPILDVSDFLNLQHQECCLKLNMDKLTSFTKLSLDVFLVF